MLKNGISIIIPARNERLLEFTIGRIFSTIKIPFEIQVIDDCSETPTVSDRFPHAYHRNDTALGASRSRDMGLAKANFAVALCIDAHMDFFDDDWSRQIVDHLLAHPQDVCCFRCPRLDLDQTDIHKATVVEYGGRILEREETRLPIMDNGIVQERPFRVMLPAKWSTAAYRGTAERAREPIEVGCILGGAYAVHREWYEDGLGAPWRRQRAWGNDEQHLALPNFLLGGRNVLLPASIAHVFRPDAPYTTNVADIVYNNILLCQLVLSEDERATAIEWVLEPWSGHTVRWESEQLLCDSDWHAYRELLVRGPRTFDDYRRKWIT